MLFYVDSFLSENERLDLLCTAYSADSSSWSIKSSGNAYWIGNRFPFESPIFDELNNRIFQYFKEYSRITPFCAIQRIQSGGAMGEHSDNYEETCRFGCSVYLNDNFDGGELVYPRLMTSHKPINGRLVIHTATEPHLVNTVSNGTRYMLTCFVYGDNNQNTSITNASEH